MSKWIDAKKAVVSRDGGRCLRCHCHGATDVHHRRPRGMGGTSDDYINYGMANLVSLCRKCHDWIHANPTGAYLLGWLVKSGIDPAESPILTNDAKLWLNSDGTRRMQPLGLRF